MDVNTVLEELKESGQIDEFDRLRNRDFVGGIDLETATLGELWRAAHHLQGNIDDAARGLGAVMERIREVQAGELEAA